MNIYQSKGGYYYNNKKRISKIEYNNLINLNKQEGGNKDCIVIQCHHGLNNRLRVLFSYYKYAQLLNKKLIMIWESNYNCPGYFYDYFKPLKNVEFYKNNNNFKIDYVSSKWNEIFHPYKMYIYKDLHLKPNLEKIIKNKKDKIGNYIAIHVRRTDHTNNFNEDIKQKLTTDKEFIDFINQNKNYKIYLATDNKDTQDFYINKFKNKIVYNKKIIKTSDFRQTSLKDAIIDMYMCINANKFKGSYYSSFSGFINQNRKHLNKKNY